MTKTEANDVNDARQKLSLALREALEADRLQLDWQPELGEAGDLLGFEALARWHWDGVGPVPPSVFVPIAQHAGLMALLTARVVDQALAQLAAWRDAGLAAPRVSVNVAPSDLEDEGFAERLAAVWRRHRVGPDRLVLEITEKMPFARHARARRTLEALREAGVRIALDDFGTGQSSLSRLRDFTFDKVKIDRAFVSRITTDSASEHIVKAIITMCQGLNLEVVAEGIEDFAEALKLKALGCGMGQGYFYGRPVDAEKTLAYLAEKYVDYTAPGDETEFMNG